MRSLNDNALINHKVISFFVPKSIKVLTKQKHIKKYVIFFSLLAIAALTGITKYVRLGETIAGFPDQGFLHPHITGDINTKQYAIKSCTYVGELSKGSQENAVISDNGKIYPIINTQASTIDPCKHKGTHSNTPNYYQEWYSNNQIDHSWVLSYNFEPAYLAGLGLPNQSLPVAPYGSGGDNAFEFAIKNGTTGGYSAYLSVNANKKVNETYGIPFLGIGVFADRNNHGKPLAILSRNKKKRKFNHLNFTTQIDGIHTHRADITGNKISESVLAYSGLQLFLFSRWLDENRLISISLDYGNGLAGLGMGSFITKKWNWPIQASYYAPGGELAYINADSLKAVCGIDDTQLPRPMVFDAQTVTKQTPKNYQLDLSAIYQCASELGAFSEPMPDDAPLTGVLWAVESAASAQPAHYAQVLSVAISKMRLSNKAD